MIIKSNDELLNLKILLPVLILLVIKISVVNVSSLISLISFLEFILLFAILIIKGVKNFLLLLIIIVSTSFDVPAFVNPVLTELPSVTNLPSFGVLGFFFLILIALIKLKINPHTTQNFLKEDKNLSFLIKFSVYLIFSGLFMGFISLIISDNNIPLNVFLVFFKLDFSKYFISSVLILLYAFQIRKSHTFSIDLRKILFNTLIALIIGGFISTLIGVFGFYGESEIILIPLPFFFSTCVILFLFKSKIKKEIFVLLLVSILALYLQFNYANALSGKSWSVLFFLLIIIYFFYLKGSLKIPIIFLLLGFVSFSSLNVFGLAFNSKENDLISRKIEEAISILDITQDNYYENIDASPKARIDEFLNVIEEYNQKPFFSILGKGFGGSTKDHIKAFGSFQSSYFSDNEYIYGSFVFLHETINIMTLKFGLVGIVMFIILLIRIIKSGLRNEWLVIGFLWLFFFLGYTFSLGVFGIAALVLGLYSSKIKNSIQGNLVNND